MAHREPRPDPRLPPRRRPQAPPANTNPAPASAPRARQPAPEPGDFLGLGMELSAKSRRDAAAQVRANELNPPSPPPAALPPLPNVSRMPAPGSYFGAPAPESASTSRAPAPSPAHDNRANAPRARATSGPDPRQANVAPPTRPGTVPPGTLRASAPQANPRAPAAPPAPTTLSGLMQPLPFETAQQPPAAEPVRTNSWLLALDDARAGRAGAEPVVADPSNVLRAPRVARPLDTSFSEPEPVTRRSAPWLVGGLLAIAVCSLVFVFGSTLTHIDPDAAHTKVVPPVAPDARVLVHEALSDPLDPGAKSAKHRQTTSSRPLPQSSKAASVPPPTNVPSTAIPDSDSAAQRPSAMPRTRPQPPQESPSAPPQQDILILPDPASASTPADPPDLAPAPGSGGGEQASKPAPAGEPLVRAGWWSGSLRTAPLAVNESGPAPDEYAASSERQARVAQWLMAQSRGASPIADAAGVFPFVDPAASNVSRASSPKSSSGEDAREASDVTSRSPVVAAASTLREPKSASDAETTPVSILWEGSTVPADRISANVRLLTPQVGRVRVDLRNGHAIEGKLYAVGTGRVWVDADVGRVALLRGEIARLEQVATVIDDTDEEVVADAVSPSEEKPAEPMPAAPEAQATPAPAKTAPAPATVPEPPPRVRVRTPGGVFFGQIVRRDGSNLTLLTDEGSRITLESDDVDLAPIQKPVVKHAPAKKPAAPGTAPEPH